MNRLSVKLGGALLLVVLVSVGIMAFLTNQNTASEFRLYVQRGSMIYNQTIADNLGQYYSQKRGWAGVQDVLTTMPRSGMDRLVLEDSSGVIVGDTALEWLGRATRDVQLSNGTPVTASGREVGTLYTTLGPGMMGRGQGGMGMMGRSQPGTGFGGGPSAVSVETAAAEFLSHINSHLWLAGIIALAVALIVGVFLTRQILRPVKALTAGAHKIAVGDLGYRVKVGSKDELGELAQSFNAMASSLDRSEQSRRRLVSDVAHELRTPLTIIEGTVDGIMDGVFVPDHEHLSSIKEQTAMLTRLVSDLRDLSQAESGQMKLDIAPADMGELVRRKLSQFEPAAREKGIQLKLSAPGPAPEVGVDSFRLEQVIANLLTNAIRHTPPGGLITATVKPDSDVRSLLISIADTGEGIAPEHLTRIFERFYRVQDARSRSDGGAGLGLAIVKQMIEAHGGKVWAESEAGKGSTFYISLPISKQTPSYPR